MAHVTSPLDASWSTFLKSARAGTLTPREQAVVTVALALMSKDSDALAKGIVEAKGWGLTTNDIAQVAGLIVAQQGSVLWQQVSGDQCGCDDDASCCE